MVDNDKTNRIYDFISSIPDMAIFWSNDIDKFFGLRKELTLLNEVFNFGEFPSVYYRGFKEIVRIACALYLGAISVTIKPISYQLSLNSINTVDELHHSKYLSQIITSQFPFIDEDNLIFSRLSWDLRVKDIVVEVGACRVTKVIEALKQNLTLWVIPEPIELIYKFSKGDNWYIIKEWEKKDMQRLHAEYDRIFP